MTTITFVGWPTSGIVSPDWRIPMLRHAARAWSFAGPNPEAQSGRPFGSRPASGASTKDRRRMRARMDHHVTSSPLGENANRGAGSMPAPLSCSSDAPILPENQVGRISASAGMAQLQGTSVTAAGNLVVQVPL